MQNTEFCHTNGQFFVAAIATVEDKTVTGTVHGLKTEFLLVNVKDEHIVFVILPVTRSFPQLAVEHVGRDDWKEGHYIRNEKAEISATVYLLGSRVYDIPTSKSKTFSFSKAVVDLECTNPHKLHQSIVNSSTMR